MTTQFLNIIQSKDVLPSVIQTAVPALSVWAAVTAAFFTLRANRITRIFRKRQRRSGKGNAGTIILGFLTLFLVLACLIGIFYFMAVGNYYLVIVCGLIPVLIMIFALAFSMK